MSRELRQHRTMPPINSLKSTKSIKFCNEQTASVNLLAGALYQAVRNFLSARYLNLPNKEAAEYLAGTFGIVTGEPETLRQKSERKRREQERRELQQWEEWQDNTFRTLTQYQQFMLEGMRFGSGHWWTKYHQKESIIEYYLDCLAEDPERFYQTYRNEVKRIAEAVDREYQNRRSAGG